jgi:hypothetical protein
LGYSSKIKFFFQNKNQKNKIKLGNVKKAGWEIKLQFLKEIQDLIVPIMPKNGEKIQIQCQIK